MDKSFLLRFEIEQPADMSFVFGKVDKVIDVFLACFEVSTEGRAKLSERFVIERLKC